jgi:hypothetical protein
MRKGSNRSMLFISFRSSILSTYPVQPKSLMLLALGYTGERVDVFNKARQLVLRCDPIGFGLSHQQSKPVFVNQLDGLEGNDRFLVIGPTNHWTPAWVFDET